MKVIWTSVMMGVHVYSGQVVCLVCEEKSLLCFLLFCFFWRGGGGGGGGGGGEPINQILSYLPQLSAL